MSATIDSSLPSFHTQETSVDFYDLCDEHFANIEKELNFYGHIPFVSSVSGPLRVFVGLVQVISSVVKAPFELIADFYGRSERMNQSRFNHTFRNVIYIAHGVANVLRGCVEVLPFQGNLYTILYDVCKFRLVYPTESNKHLYNRVLRGVEG